MKMQRRYGSNPALKSVRGCARMHIRGVLETSESCLVWDTKRSVRQPGASSGRVHSHWQLWLPEPTNLGFQAYSSHRYW
jgi:hypothetical protein